MTIANLGSLARLASKRSVSEGLLVDGDDFGEDEEEEDAEVEVEIED